jgi:UDPglucose 6-dehydrogenase
LHAISVLGCGYLGVTHAACLAELGHDVTAVDIDARRVAALADGRVPFYERGLQELVTRHLANGRLRFTTSYARAAAEADVHFICVGTPQRGDGAADLRSVDAVVEELGPRLTTESLVVGKSTVPVGTTARIAERLRRTAPAGAGVRTAWNPEFLREGHAVADTLRPDRIVLGVTSASDEKVLRDVYARLADAGVPFVVTDPATAELAKSAANAFLATKISFINALAEVCEAAGADVGGLADALAHDPRIGARSLRPGVGFGGGCLPKDLRALQARARELGVGHALAFLAEVDAVNLRRRERAVDLVRRQVPDGIAGRRVAVLGAAFKADSDDVRDSPALHVADALRRDGAEVAVYDPKAMANARRGHPDLHYAADHRQACAGAHAVAVLTDWPEFRDIDPRELGGVVARRSVVDGRGALDPEEWRRAGWAYTALGRPAAL